LPFPRALLLREARRLACQRPRSRSASGVGIYSSRRRRSAAAPHLKDMEYTRFSSGSWNAEPAIGASPPTPTAKSCSRVRPCTSSQQYLHRPHVSGRSSQPLCGKVSGLGWASRGGNSLFDRRVVVGYLDLLLLGIIQSALRSTLGRCCLRSFGDLDNRSATPNSNCEY
jgi:hypothetical protein